MKTYLRLLQFARPVSKYAIPYFLFTLLHAFFNMVVFMGISPILESLFSPDAVSRSVTALPRFAVNTRYISDLVNYFLLKLLGTGYDTIDVLIGLSVFIVAVAFLSNLFRYLSQRTIERYRIHTLQNLRNALFSNVMSLHAGYFSNERKGDILSKLTSDVQVVQFAVTNTLQVAFREPFLMAGYLFILISTSARLTLFTIVVLPVIALVIGVIVKTLRKSAKEAQESLGDMVTTAEEALGGIKILKGYNAIDYIVRKFRAQNQRFARISKNMANRQTMASPMSEFLGISAISIVLVYGGKMVMGGGISADNFLMYIAVFSQLTRPMRAFMDAFSTIHQGLAAGERVLSLIDTPSQITDAPDAVALTEFRQGIEFRDVSFSYENREVLRRVSVEIRKGETVALVGPSGGGKSTISDLIPRFYDPQAGSILIDGVDIRQYSLESMRSHLGIVAQDTVLFNDTIENNIKLGKPGASHEEVVRAAQVANAYSFILETEQGFETNTGDRGMKLSGGQRQRLSIARAVLKNPDILILDEATSALDTESEKLVQEALNNLLKGRTSLVIAHRLSTINNADKIIVVDQGEIVETGTHAELIALRGVYHRLIEMQQIGTPQEHA
ncbi:MAG: ABC transporter ATP-binding protein/permease [Rikenellaceae bacterium]|jgi:subfamily B ATP-binding cassette protein MsbA|nr:ABC transporter ATP-binding protein/permease [Rikenellaceae bacterium]